MSDEGIPEPAGRTQNRLLPASIIHPAISGEISHASPSSQSPFVRFFMISIVASA